MAWLLAEQFSPRNRVQGKCNNCHSDLRPRSDRASGREIAVLTDITVDFEGDIEFCATCIGEVAEKLGYVKPELFIHVTEENTELKAEKAQLTLLVEEQSGSIRALTLELNRALASADLQTVDA